MTDDTLFLLGDDAQLLKRANIWAEGFFLVNGTQHLVTAGRLVSKGYLERFVLDPPREDAQWGFKITDAGREAYRQSMASYQRAIDEIDAVEKRRALDAEQQEIVNDPNVKLAGFFVGSLAELPIWAREYIKNLRLELLTSEQQREWNK